MERRHFLKSVAVAGLAGTVSTACSDDAKSKQVSDPTLQPVGTIVHSVYFWLAENLTEEDEVDFLNFFFALKEVPGVRTLQFGKPAPTTPRPVVDNSFSYCLIVTFDKMDDINVYETHQAHLDAVEKYKHYWTKVLVTDMVIS